jgi:Tol biopolymer transport system component
VEEANALTFHAFDPHDGKQKELARVTLQPFPSAVFNRWDVSPDGTQIVFFPGGDAHTLRILRLRDASMRDLTVNSGAHRLQTISWAASGRGFFSVGATADEYALLHIGLDGEVQFLWRRPNSQWLAFPVPSPDGRYLAFGVQEYQSNAWLLENF